MWRNESVHSRGNSEWLDEAIARVAADRELRVRADAALSGVAAQEPLFAEALNTPQSPPYHCEGPFLRHHLRLQLQVLFAILTGKLHLLDIEEFRRLKGYEGEIEEMEETIKENAGTFEAFVLCHDVSKWSSVFFTAEKGSRGAALGFEMEASARWEDIGASERAKFRERYQVLWDTFVRDHAHESDRHAELAFFDAYGIRVHFPGHHRLVHAPVYRGLVERVAFAHRLPAEDVRMLEDMIAWHLKPLEDFREVRAERIERYVRFAREQGYDADDFLDRLQAAAFLDGVASSERFSVHGAWHESTQLVNFFRSEHDYAPHRRVEREAARAEEARRRRNRLLREFKLDGLALLELTGMEAGKAFGALLKAVQAAVCGERPMPHFKDSKIRAELERRCAEFRKEVERTRSGA